MSEMHDEENGEDDWAQPAWWYSLPPVLIVAAVTVAALVLFGALFGPWIGVVIVVALALSAGALWRVWRGEWP